MQGGECWVCRLAPARDGKPSGSHCGGPRPAVHHLPPQITGVESRGPRCHGLVAMADAIVALTSNIALATSQCIEFVPRWFALSEDPSKDKDAATKKARIAPCFTGSPCALARIPPLAPEAAAPCSASSGWKTGC